MMKRLGSDYLFECDECGDVLETGEADFDDAISFMKQMEWCSRRDGKIWQHRCMGCEQGVNL
jgi:hypothetical protein